MENFLKKNGKFLEKKMENLLKKKEKFLEKKWKIS